MFILSLFSPEDIEVKPEHVKCGKSSYSIFNRKQKLVAMKGCSEYLVFAEKPRKRRNSGNGEAGNKECQMGNRKVLAKSAHFCHQVSVNCMYDCSCSKKQKRFE